MYVANAARQTEIERLQKKLLLAILIAATVVHRELEGLIEGNALCAHFHVGFRAEEIVRLRHHRKILEDNIRALLDGEMRIHIRHDRGFFCD